MRTSAWHILDIGSKSRIFTPEGLRKIKLAPFVCTASAVGGPYPIRNPQLKNWVCFAQQAPPTHRPPDTPGRPSLALFCIVIPMSPVPLAMSRPVPAEWALFVQHPRPANHKSYSIIRKPELPLPMLRVARIVPEFRARAARRTRATPCSQRNKEFLARGVF